MANILSSHTEIPIQAGGFPPFQKDTFASQLIWLAISFVLLYALVAKVGLPRVGGILEKRRVNIAGNLAEADRRELEANAVMDGYERALRDGRTQAGTLIGKTQQDLKAEAKRDHEMMEMAFNIRVTDAERSITAAKAAAATDIRTIAIESANAIVLRLNGTVPSREGVSSAVDRALGREG